jgi:hypothetical protein
MPRSNAATVDITVDRNSVTVDMQLQLRENLTALPQVKIFLNSSNSTVVSQPMRAAVEKLVPNSRVDIPYGRVETRLVDSSTQMWLLQENFTLEVSGTSADLGGIVRVNLAFLPMNVSDTVKIGGLEINLVGRVYLVQALEGLPVSTTSTYFLNGHTFGNTVIPGRTTAQFDLLDFTWVPPLSSWTHHYQPFEDSTWKNSPSPPFNLTVGVRQVENIFFPTYVAAYSASLDLKAPAGAWSDGNTITFKTSTALDILMPVIIVSTLVTMMVTFFVDRKFTGSVRFRKKKKT